MKRKIVIIFISIISFFFIWFGESRKFYCLDNGRCITVWKTFNNICYVLPEKYYGIWKPSNNYIETSNLNLLTIFITEELPKALIVQSEEKLKVYEGGGFVFLDYNLDSAKLNKILYKANATKFSEVKENTYFLDIDIKENYARNKNGKVF